MLTYSGYYEIGIGEVWNMIDEYIAFVKKNGYFEHKRQEQAKYWMLETINDQLKSHFYQNSEIRYSVLKKRKIEFCIRYKVLLLQLKRCWIFISVKFFDIGESIVPVYNNLSGSYLSKSILQSV